MHTSIISIEINWRLTADIHAPLRPDEQPSAGMNEAAGRPLFCIKELCRNSPSCVNIYTKLHVKGWCFGGSSAFRRVVCVNWCRSDPLHDTAASKDVAPGRRPDFVRRAIARQPGEQAVGHCIVGPVAMAASLVHKLGSGSGIQGPARWLEKMNEKCFQPSMYRHNQISNR